MELTFEKGGIIRLVHTPAEAVQLRADGWIEVTEETVAEEVDDIDDDINVTPASETSNSNNDTNKNGEAA